jgi:uncharacterized membrane protein (UPF0127 family)
VKRPLIVTIVAIVLVVLAIGALIYVTQWKGSTYTSVVDLTVGNGVVLHLNVEVADTPDEWRYGLMNRNSMPEDAGMLFVFDDYAPRSFWMKDTLIPLDMIFIDDNRTIIDIHRNATPLSEDRIISSGPCRFVLEVNGGLCAAEGIDIGDHITLDLT